MVQRKYLTLLIGVVVIISALGAAFLLLPPSKGDMDITIAYSEKVNYETLIVANEEGMFADHGLNVSTKLVTGGILAAEALITGSADLAAMGDAPAVQVITKVTGAKIVARFIGAAGMHRIIAWNLILEPKDLEGKKVGLQETSSSHGAFLQWCEVNGVNADNITIVPMAPSNIPEAMAFHQIDAMVGSEPWAVNTENLCGDDVHELGNSSGLGSTFPIVLVASEKALNDRPEAIKAVVKALDQSNQFIMENWDDAMEICASRTGLSIADQSRCSAMQFFEVGFNETDVLSMNMTAQVLLDFGKITALPDVMAHVELSFLLKD
ncbi:MAG TPA: ABC transporter substrate-binding protein [Methanomassiliicoccales archaeon]|nr:ABC transporter substrate-binding protein [Methanomassiliicoccales archaeon]